MKSIGICCSVASLIVLTQAVVALAQPQGADPSELALLQHVQVVARSHDGAATFVTGRNGQAIPVVAGNTRAGIEPVDFIVQYGRLFGVADVDRQLVKTRVAADDLGATHTTFEQLHEGVPVFSGVLKVHTNAQGEVFAANGDFRVVSEKIAVVPALAESDALALVLADMDAAQATVDRAELVIVDPGWYGDPPRGARLAYYFIVSDLTVPMREAFFIDARTGEVLDQWSLIMTARDRKVYNGNGTATLPGTLARVEGGPPVASPADVNRAYDYAGDIYDYYARAHNRDSIDGAGMSLLLTVNSTDPDCPNAYWDSVRMVFCSGTVTDDVTAHEMTHGVTEHTANLIYQNQPGQLNESYSDVFGELIDLYNGNASNPGTPAASGWPTHATGPGQDTPNNLRSACSTPSSYANGVRWLMGEDATAFGGAIRDMWNPTCMGDPDRGNSSLQTCPALDGGGVHSGSGIPNHAFAIVTDGKTFNGQTVTGIGPIKAGAVWFRALAFYLTPGSDFKDAAVSLNQAAADLVGTTPNDPITGAPSASVFTADDAVQVGKAVIATEMNVDGACGATVDILDPTPPALCDPRTALFADNFEGGINGWTTSLVGSPEVVYQWVQVSDLPFNRPGTAWYCADPANDCPDGLNSAVHQLTSPSINLPAQADGAMLQFTHYLASEPDYDGGNIKISVNGGPFNLVPASAFTYNDYNITLQSSTSTNPLAGQPAWSGAGGQWGTSVINLDGIAGAGDALRVRFEFGKDFCNGLDGWYVDDFEIFFCSCTIDAECDDGLFCNGVETCVNNLCAAGTDPCPGGLCDDTADACAIALFVEDFNSGNGQGWTLRGTGSTSTFGDWLIGNPNGTSTGGSQAQPEDPYEGAGCAFTAQNTDLGTNDVDEGVVYLVSPVLNLSGLSTAQLNYVRWFYNRDTGEDSGDFFIAQVSSNNGSTWVTLENLNQLVNANAWIPKTFDLQNFITLTSTVRVRFGAADGTATGNLIEAAVDAMVITTIPDCQNAGECADGNVCNGAEDCVAGDCIAGTPLVCDDGVACTVDTCDALTGCAFTPNDGNCPDDGAYCNGTEHCDALLGCSSTGDPCGGATWCAEFAEGCLAYGDGDMDVDGDHDLLDFALFQACFGSPAGPACAPANMQGDAMVDPADLQSFVTELSADGPN